MIQITRKGTVEIMKKKLIRVTSLVLVVVTVLSLFAGCSKGETVTVKPLVPEKQIFEDSYTKNADITEEQKRSVDLPYSGLCGRTLYGGYFSLQRRGGVWIRISLSLPPAQPKL